MRLKLKIISEKLQISFATTKTAAIFAPAFRKSMIP